MAKKKPEIYVSTPDYITDTTECFKHMQEQLIHAMSQFTSLTEQAADSAFIKNLID